MRLNSFLLLFIFFISLELFAVKPNDLNIILTENKTVISEWEVPNKVSLNDFLKILGGFDRMIESGGKKIYLWDSFGINLRLDKDSKFVEQLSIYLKVKSDSSEPKNKFSGKIQFKSPTPESDTMSAKGVFYKITIGKRNLFGICNIENQDIETLMISLN
jgi:hypothetical protein